MWTRSDRIISYSGELHELKKYLIGVVRNYVNSPELNDAEYQKKEKVTSDAMNLKKLLGGRVDLIVGDKYVIINAFKNNPTVQATLSDVRMLKPPLLVHTVHALFSRNIDNWEEKLARFNKALQTMKDDGTLDHIFISAGFKEEDVK